jgi:hypothetical protein
MATISKMQTGRVGWRWASLTFAVDVLVFIGGRLSLGMVRY